MCMSEIKMTFYDHPEMFSTSASLNWNEIFVFSFETVVTYFVSRISSRRVLCIVNSSTVYYTLCGDTENINAWLMVNQYLSTVVSVSFIFCLQLSLIFFKSIGKQFVIFLVILIADILLSSSV